MPTEKQRREAAKRHLERQLERRQERAIRRRQTNLYLSIGGTLALVAAIILTVVLVNSGSDKKPSAASQPGTTHTPTGTPTAPTSTAPTTPAKTYGPAKGASVTFDGVTVKGAADTGGVPYVTIKAGADPTKVEYKDLVVGTGKPASPSASVTAQYVGAVYKTGKVFQSSWNQGNAVPFTLGPGNVIDGFTDGIGGMTGIPPMHAGGRRIIIMPAALAYGASPPSGSGIPANATLVFVVDLVSVTS